jgi:hypothetical protein
VITSPKRSTTYSSTSKLNSRRPSPTSKSRRSLLPSPLPNGIYIPHLYLIGFLIPKLRRPTSTTTKTETPTSMRSYPSPTPPPSPPKLSPTLPIRTPSITSKVPSMTSKRRENSMNPKPREDLVFIQLFIIFFRGERHRRWVYRHLQGLGQKPRFRYLPQELILRVIICLGQICIFYVFVLINK